MCIVPCIIVDQDSSIRHSSDLVTIIPPRHDLGILGSVLFNPVVSLTIVIDDISGTIVLSSGKDDGWGTVGL